MFLHHLNMECLTQDMNTYFFLEVHEVCPPWSTAYPFRTSLSTRLISYIYTTPSLLADGERLTRPTFSIELDAEEWITQLFCLARTATDQA